MIEATSSASASSSNTSRGWRGFGRIPTDAKGGFEFSTIKPGRVQGPEIRQG